MTFREKKLCRLCGEETRVVFDLGEFAVSDFVESGEETPRAPLALAECPDCRLVQLRHSVDRDLLYRRYWYWSGLNSSMIESLRDVVRGVEARVPLAAGDCVVDIGANDGTLLSLYEEPELFKVGFDPAENAPTGSRERCNLFVEDYFETSEVETPKAKVVTSIAMFYDLDEPQNFIDRVLRVLADDGVWIVQMTDLVRMLRANAFDNVCHEHVAYYSLEVFEALMRENGLSVFDIETNDVNGGSVRAYVCRKEAGRIIHSRVHEALADERQYLKENPIAAFRERVEAARASLVRFVRDEISRGKFFHALGASTKGNTLLQFYGLTNEEIGCAAEVNPEKFGRVTAGTGIPIVPQAASLEEKPDYYLVLPWHFVQFFLRKFDDYLGSGGALVCPLPRPTLYTRDAVLDIL